MNVIIDAGVGWIGAGIVSGGAWFELLEHGIMDYGMLSVCILVLVVGICIIAFNKKIESIKKRILEGRGAQA